MKPSEQIEEKIKQQVKQSIQQQKKDALSSAIVKKEMFAFAPELKSKMNLSIALACFGEIFGFASYFFAAFAAATLAENRLDVKKLWLYATIAILCVALQKLLTWQSSIRSHQISFRILSRLRSEVSRKLENVPMGYILETPIGKYKEIIVERISSLEDWIAHTMPELPSRLLHPLLSTLILFFLDWRLGLAAFSSLPIIFLAFAIMFYKREERMYTWLNSSQEMNSTIVEYVNGISVIKAFGQNSRSYQKYENAVNYFYSSTMNWWKQSWVSMALFFACTTSPLWGVLPISSYLYMNRQIPLWMYLISLILPLSILANVFVLIMSTELYQMIETSWRMLREVFHLPELKRSSQEASLDPDKNFEFQNVSFAYKDNIEVLKNVSFTVPVGKVTAIVGPSGSGKSTIAKLMAGFWEETKGKILFGGVPCQEIPHNQRMNEIAYVAQDNFLFDCSIRENLLLANPKATEEMLKQAIQMANCQDLIERLPQGLDTQVGDCGGLLSGGERQRITLARAILKPSRCIILDEATAYSDPENEALIQQAVSRLVQGKTLIVVAHRLHTIMDADQILVVENGQVSAIGTHKELLQQSPIYLKLWNKYQGTDQSSIQKGEENEIL